MDREEWKDIKGYEGLYQVSNMGRVKTLANDKYRKEKIRKLRFDKDGYLQLNFNQNKEKETPKVHRLVAEAFIPNPENKSEVHHIDKSKTNNCVENLIWVTPEEHAALHSGDETRNKPSKKVEQYTLDGKLIKVWESACQIQREKGYKQSSIWACCNRKPHHKTAYGFIWAYDAESQHS